MTYSHTTTRWLSLLALLAVCSAAKAQSVEPRVAELQRDFAVHYLEPAAHMALAKYYAGHEKRIEAFFVLEAARRGLFDEKTFNASFLRDFEGFDNSKAAESRLLSEYARDPNSIETIFKLADIYISRDDFVSARRFLQTGMQKKPDDYRFTEGLMEIASRQQNQKAVDELENEYLQKFPETPMGYARRAEKVTEAKPLEARILLTQALQRFPAAGRLWFDLGVVYQGEDYQKAEESYVKAAELAPQAELVQLWVGRFFFKLKKDYRRALEYYLNAYFLNPHAYETEYAESRIRSIFEQISGEEFEKQIKAGVPLPKLLQHANSSVIAFALERISQQWSPSYVDPLVELMAHEDGGVRWQATEILKTKVDAAFDER
ncbi:MAG TPA: hypothetical protein VLL54_00265 [Pyrinomonadaceae bacterium]|nr:hypothetical protein [Pyrinomonadaceae bacterium]